MNYEIRKIQIPYKVSEVIEFEAENLCKIIKAVTEGDSLYLIVMERWGSTKSPGHKHKVVLLKPNYPFSITLPYEPVLSRRGEVHCYGEEHYLFQL